MVWQKSNKEFEQSLSKHRKWVIPILVLWLLGMVIFIPWYFIHTNQKDNTFLARLHLKVAFKVVAVDTTGDHDFGVLYGNLVSSNKPDGYIAEESKKYTFCKIKGRKILLTLQISDFQKGDSVIVSTNPRQYWIYRNSSLAANSGFSFSTDPVLHYHIEENHYMDFNRYTNL